MIDEGNVRGECNNIEYLILKNNDLGMDQYYIKMSFMRNQLY